ncbi:MAG: inorganic diphosphatase [Bacteroidota bacterium]
MNRNPNVYWLILLLSWAACRESGKELSTLPAVTEGGINAVIEIPAGTNHKIEYDYSTRRFAVDQEAGKDRVINFLPYPANYGFIPSTLMDEARGGDGDALDVIVIAESLKTGTNIKVQPIAALLLEDAGELDTKIIAVPVDSVKNTIQVKTFSDFTVRYNAAQQILQQWFLNYKGPGQMQLIGWRNERYAMAEIEKWRVEQPR